MFPFSSFYLRLQVLFFQIVVQVQFSFYPHSFTPPQFSLPPSPISTPLVVVHVSFVIVPVIPSPFSPLPSDHCQPVLNFNVFAYTLPISKWTDQKTMVHLHNGILCSRKKEGTPTLCDNMDGSREHYAKWSKPGGERQIPYDLTFNWNLINKMNKQAKYS